MINTLEMKIKKKALGELGMFSLEKRRICGDLFFPNCHKQVNRNSFSLKNTKKQVNIGRSKGFDFN